MNDEWWMHILWRVATVAFALFCISVASCLNYAMWKWALYGATP